MARWRAEEGAGMEWPEEGAARKKERQGMAGNGAAVARTRGVRWAGPPEKGAEEHAASRRRAAEASSSVVAWKKRRRRGVAAERRRSASSRKQLFCLANGEERLK